MSTWPAAKARRVLAALLRIGWSVKRSSGSHRTLSRTDWPDVVFAFHDEEEIGPRMLARIAKKTGLTPEEPEDVTRERAKGNTSLWRRRFHNGSQNPTFVLTPLLQDVR